MLVDVKLLDYAAKKYGAKKVGLILVNNPWGESNDKGLAEAVKSMTGMEIIGSEKFENNDVDMVPQLTRLKDKGADVLILVGNAAPGAQVMKARERLSWKVPVVSHWGISGGRFPELTGPTAGDAGVEGDGAHGVRLHLGLMAPGPRRGLTARRSCGREQRRG